MAESKSGSRSSASRSSGSRSSGSRSRQPRKKPSGVGVADVSQAALKQLGSLVGHPTEGVSSVHRNDDGWVVQIEVLEMRRIPNTTDVLATYEVNLDDDASVVGYRRMHRYTRAQTEEG